MPAPIFYKEAFYGFIGLDNPNLELTSLFIQLPRLVGGHLGSTRENFMRKFPVIPRCTV